MTLRASDRIIAIVDIADHPAPLDGARQERVVRALDTLPRLDAVVFWMMAVEKLGAVRTARRLGMTRWEVRHHMRAAIAHIDRVMRAREP